MPPDAIRDSRRYRSESRVPRRALTCSLFSVRGGRPCLPLHRSRLPVVVDRRTGDVGAAERLRRPGANHLHDGRLGVRSWRVGRRDRPVARCPPMLAAGEACASLAAMRRSLALAAALLVTWPALARAQSSPFTPLPQAPHQPATAPATTPTTTTGSGGGDSGLSGSAETALLVSGGVLIAL